MTRLSRRGFLKGAVALGAGAVLFRYTGGFRIVLADAGPTVRQLRIVHTNDHHARIEPVSVTIRSGDASGPRNLGGVARRKTIFDAIRAEASPADKLFLDAGDYFQGTLYFNQYEGKADRYFYNRLGYAAATIGNHEFDKGDQVLANFISGVPVEAADPAEPTAFPIVSSNITAAAASPLAALFEEQIEVTLDANGVVTGPAIGKWCHRVIVNLASGEKVGIVGLTTVETTNIASPSAAITFNPNYAEIVNTQAAALRTAGCDTVIALTHIGYANDLALAAQLTGVNVVVGGHSHTPLLPNGLPVNPGANPVDVYPRTITGADGNTVVVVQDWEWGKWVGDLTFGLDDQGRVSEVIGTSTVLPVWGELLPARSGQPPRELLPDEPATVITPDAAFQTAITDVFKPAIQELAERVIGTNTTAVTNTDARARENELGNFLADAVRAKVAEFSDNTPDIPLVAILNGGGIRAGLDQGPITVGEVLTVMPFGNTVGRVTVTGRQLKAALENGVSALRPNPAVDAARAAVGTGRFPNVSGMRYTVDVTRPAAQPPLAATNSAPAVPARPGERITSVEILERQSDGTDAYVPLDLDKEYRVATLSFVINGGDGYSAFTPGGDLADPAVGGATGQIDSGLIDADVVQEYIAAQPDSTLDLQLSGRITVVVQRLFMPFMGRPAATQPQATAAD
jgi:5'-nucleotidase